MCLRRMFCPAGTSSFAGTEFGLGALLGPGGHGRGDHGDGGLYGGDRGKVPKEMKLEFPYFAFCLESQEEKRFFLSQNRMKAAGT